MYFIYQTHRIFGEMILPLLIVGVAIYMTVVYKPGAPRGMISNIFPFLVDLQVGIGIIYWLSLLSIPALTDRYLSMPFILHPILGIIAAVLGHMAVGAKNPLGSLGRWAPLASLGVLLVLVLSNIMVVAMRTM